MNHDSQRDIEGLRMSDLLAHCYCAQAHCPGQRAKRVERLERDALAARLIESEPPPPDEPLRQAPSTQGPALEEPNRVEPSIPEPADATKPAPNKPHPGSS